MKKFFEKAKLEYKFKKAGEGHTLEEDSRASSRQQASTSQTPAVRAAPSSDSQKAGQVSCVPPTHASAYMNITLDNTINLDLGVSDFS